MRSAAHMVRQNAHGGRIALVCIALLFVMLLIQSGGCANRVHVGDLTVDADIQVLDAQDANIKDIHPILRLTALTELDLRGNAITLSDYQQIKAALPECRVRWSVPISGTYADSESQVLTLPAFTEADIGVLLFFPNLTQVNASGSTEYSALRQARETYPVLTFTWTVVVCGQTVDCDIETLDLSGQTVDVDALSIALPELPRLREVALHNAGIRNDTLARLRTAYPHIAFYADPNLFGVHYDADTTDLDLTGYIDLDVETLLSELAAFTALERVNLRGCDLSNEQRAALMAAYPNIAFEWIIDLLPDLFVDSKETTVVIPYKDPDTTILLDRLMLLPNLKSIDMTACYTPSDETNARMEALKAACPHVRFIWLVRIGNWELRTDITAFSMGNQETFAGGRYAGGGTYSSVTNASILPLQYCTDLIALDIGHATRVTDIGCIAGLTKIRYLILGMTGITSLAPLSGMVELEFLECYQSWISDLSPLLQCKKLKYLNCSTTFVESTKDVVQMTQLKRLWIMRPQALTQEDIAQIKAALPNTIVRSMMPSGGHSTSGGWRTKNPAYLYMQTELFHLSLREQDTKWIGDPEYWEWEIEAFEKE